MNNSVNALVTTNSDKIISPKVCIESNDHTDTTKINLDTPVTIRNDVPFFGENEMDNCSHFQNIAQHCNNRNNLKENLRQWVSTHNITVNAVNALVQILNLNFCIVPNDYRTLMGTPRKTEITVLKNGKLTYFGIQKKLQVQLKSGLKSNVDKILLKVNIDGLPLFKSSSLEFYPILAVCNECIDASPFAIALFCGTGKPEPIEIFLTDFIKECKYLKLNGIQFEGNLYSFDIHYFICDAPARSYLRQTIGHTGKEACEKCTMIGQYKNYRINFSQEHFIPFPPKLDSDFMLTEKPKYIKGISPLLDLDIKMVKQFPLDPMHTIFLGVVKRLLLCYFFDKSSAFKLSQNLKRILDERSTVLCGYITADFNRKCRSFKEIHRWKATEYRLFILYTYPVLFYEVLSKEQFELILMLHCAIFILSSYDLTEKYCHIADKLLKNFVTKSAQVLNDDFVVFNVHNLIHIVEDVKLYGSLNDFSCFPFENYLYILKNKLHSTSKPLEQIHRRIEEIDNLKFNAYSVTEPHKIAKCEPRIMYDEIMDENGELTSFYCKKNMFL